MFAARVFRGAAVLLLAVGVGTAATQPTSVHAADPGPVELAIIAPIVAPAGEDGLLDADLLETYTAPAGELTRQLDAVAGRPVTLAIDPMIVASIRVLGTAAPASATQWLTRLENVTNESFLLTYADSDATLGTQAGSPIVLGPQTFDFAIDPALFGPAATATPTPTPAPTAGATPALPTTAELTAWNSDYPGLLWPRAGTVSTADIPKFTASGFSSVALSSGNVTREPTLGPSVVVSEVPTIITDDSVSGALAIAANTSTPAGLQAAIPGLQSAIASAGQVQDGQPSVVAAFDRSVPRQGTNVAGTLAALQATASVTLVPLSVALDGSSEGTASLVDSVQDPERLAEGERLLLAEGAEARYATIVENPSALTAPRRLTILALMAVGWVDNPSGWSVDVQRYLTDSETLRSAVEIVTTSPFTLLADNGTLPIPVSNNLAQPVRVFLTVRPLTAKLAVTESLVEVVIEPNAQGSAKVPVESISNGSVQVVMTLSSASGAQIGQPAITEINVQAGWETPIVLGIGGLVVLVFAGGIVRNIVRRRRAVVVVDDAADDPVNEKPASHA